MIRKETCFLQHRVTDIQLHTLHCTYCPQRVRQWWVCNFAVQTGQAHPSRPSLLVVLGCQTIPPRGTPQKKPFFFRSNSISHACLPLISRSNPGQTNQPRASFPSIAVTCFLQRQLCKQKFIAELIHEYFSCGADWQGLAWTEQVSCCTG
jgi:hypothetical protein